MMWRIGDEQKHHHADGDAGDASGPRPVHCRGSALGTMQDIATKCCSLIFFGAFMACPPGARQRLFVRPPLQRSAGTQSKKTASF